MEGGFGGTKSSCYKVTKQKQIKKLNERVSTCTYRQTQKTEEETAYTIG